MAVLLGISGSLWLDDRAQYASDRKYEIEAYQRLSNALTLDIEGLEEDAKENVRMIDVLDLMINNIEAIPNDSMVLYIDITQSYSDMETHISDYETLKNTGRLYNITDIDMLQRIIDMYDKNMEKLMIGKRRISGRSGCRMNFLLATTPCSLHQNGPRLKIFQMIGRV